MEAMMAGTPTIASAIGGLQDQMGFLVDGEPFGVEHLSEEVPSNSTGLISKEYGKWTYPLWPQVTLQGSPMTPYIYDSRVSIPSIKEGLRWWFEMNPEQRKTCGLAGREWAINNGFTSEAMASEMAKSINICLDNFKPRKRFTLVNTSMKQPEYPSGVLA